MKIGQWDVDDDTGLMSFEGRSVFSIYNADGNLTTEHVQYYWVNGEPQARIMRSSEVEELERIFKL